MKMTVLLLAEIEIEDEGHATAYAEEAIEAGKVDDLRLATVRRLKYKPDDGRLSWGEYLVPRLTDSKPVDESLWAVDDCALARES